MRGVLLGTGSLDCLSFKSFQVLYQNPCGNKLETFPLPNDPDRETITVDLQGTSKLDFHLDLCPRLSEWLSCCRECICVCEKLQFHHSSVRRYGHKSLLAADWELVPSFVHLASVPAPHVRLLCGRAEDKSPSPERPGPRWLFLSLSVWAQQWISRMRFRPKLLRGRLCHVEIIWSAERPYWNTLSSWTRDRSNKLPGRAPAADG